MIENLESYMLPCFSKTFLNIECFGCGLQRSFLLLLNGNLFDAFKMYPAIFTLVLLVSIAIFNFFKKIKNANKIIGRLAYLNLSIIIINYIIKISI
tara:strand:+ start:2152 stop:2439 length:288 start_codon:yes stop_codon:yes gene_type:complete